MTEHELDVLEAKYLKRQRLIMSHHERPDYKLESELMQSIPALIKTAREALVVGVVK